MQATNLFWNDPSSGDDYPFFRPTNLRSGPNHNNAGF